VEAFEALSTARAIRYLKADPVPEELIEKLIWAATRAPSPGNSQDWDFVVVTDPDKRSIIGNAVEAVMAGRTAVPDGADRTTRLMMQGAGNLARTLRDAPVIILCCGGVNYPAAAPRESFTWSAIYPAAQNIVVAARALGLGCTFTTFHGVAEPTMREALGIPDHIRIGALLPIGWPDRPHGPVQRRPVADFIHRNGWQGNLRA
jgi:nitroreductase